MRKPKPLSRKQYFEQQMYLLGKPGMSYEDGYQNLLGNLNEFVGDLIDAYQSERYVKIRILILEILIESSDERLLPIMEQCLINENYMIRNCAAQGLATINNREARMILREARHNTFPDEDETKQFRALVKSCLRKAESKYKK